MANSFLPFFIFILIVLVVIVVKGEPDLTHISAYCGSRHDESPLRKDQATRLTQGAIGGTYPGTDFCGFTSDNSYTMYDRYACSAAVSQPEDCTDCMKYAADQLLNQLCKDQYGAQITLGSCSLRYEFDPIPGCF
ncbi:unnamed protein product [Linum trigynum]|uniref:Gnk2-homologous domain-containing protein n=1 Tax=Linum trigynum TaxID=586398 RepID=A0AAV2GH91_9ROSI